MYKVLYPYSPHKEDELELMEGDYIYVSATDQGQTGKALGVRVPFLPSDAHVLGLLLYRQ